MGVSGGTSPHSSTHADGATDEVDATGLTGAGSSVKVVRVATTANGTLATAFENGDTVDGVALVTGDRILLKDQSAGAENGIYTVNASGAPTRATDYDSQSDVLGSLVFVTNGTANADTAWLCTTNATITVGSTALVFAAFGVSSSASTSSVKVVRLATTANGTLATAYENGDTLDGVALVTGDRILLKDQSAGAENGVYTVNASGAPTRATDFDSQSDVLGSLTFVTNGTANADTAWLCTTNATITVGSTALVFAAFGAGTGGGGGFVTDSTDGAKLDSGRNYISGPAGHASAENIYMGGGYIDLSAGAGGEIEFFPDGDTPVRFGGGGGLLLSPDNGVTPSEEGQIMMDDADNTPMAMRPRLWTQNQWLHLVTGSGWMPYAFPMGYTQDGVYTTALNLAAAHGTLAIPFMMTAPMHLAAVSFWNTDAASARSFEVALWHQPHYSNSSLDKLLVKVENSQEFSGSFTPVAASLRSCSYGSGCIVPAGLVWLTIKNIHATNTLGIGYAAGSTQMPINTGQTKTLDATAFDGDTLDFIAATWTKVINVYGVSLRGKVFGESSTF